MNRVKVAQKDYSFSPICVVMHCHNIHHKFSDNSICIVLLINLVSLLLDCAAASINLLLSLIISCQHHYYETIGTYQK